MEVGPEDVRETTGRGWHVQSLQAIVLYIHLGCIGMLTCCRSKLYPYSDGVDSRRAPKNQLYPQPVASCWCTGLSAAMINVVEIHKNMSYGWVMLGIVS